MGNSRLGDWFTVFRTSKAGIIIFYLYLVAVVIAGISISIAFRRLHAVGVQNHRVLCNQKLGYETTFHNATDYLKKHPHGTRAFSKDVVVAAILQARTQLKAFNDVNCGS